jgi:transcriptional regulator with XRE-family HTH domain
MEMEMKTNAGRIKQLREAKSWSQEHMAEAAGLSLRTVQRVESEGNASAETRLALASVLGVDVSELGVSQAKRLREESEPAVDLKPGKRFHPSKTYFFGPIFLLACLVMMAFDFHAHHALTWSPWPFFGWCMGCVARYLRILKEYLAYRTER